MSRPPLRILHVVDSLDRGGLEHVVCDLSNEQRKMGHDVGVYCLHRPGSMAADLEALGVRVMCGAKRRGPDFRVVWDLRRHALAGSPSLLHSHSMMPNYYACAARLLAAPSITVVNTRHDMGSTRPNDRRERIFRRSVPLTSLVVMVSGGVREHFVGARIVPAAKARLVPNGIRTDFPRRTSDPQRRAARTLLSVADGDFLVGCVGRLVELKDHASAIRALAGLAPAHARLRLALVGAGPLGPRLESLARELDVADRVRFLGERQDTRTLLPGFDVFLMPSLTEGHSIALLEAAAAVLPIVATRVGGNPEIIREGLTGLLVPAGDAASMAAALLRLMNEPQFAARLAAQASSWVAAHSSVTTMANAYETIYAEALNLERDAEP